MVKCKSCDDTGIIEDTVGRTWKCNDCNGGQAMSDSIPGIIRVDKRYDVALSAICDDLWCKSSDVAKLEAVAKQMAEEIESLTGELKDAGCFCYGERICSRCKAIKDAESTLAAYREAVK